MKKFIVIAALIAFTYASPISHFNWRVVGGQAAEDGQFPYQVSLRYLGIHSCGGSIINKNWILTAAHCVFGFENVKPLMHAVAGSNKLISLGRWYSVDKIIYHENYNDLNLQFDIALIKTKTVIKFTNKIQPILLNTEDIGTGEDLVLSGWGVTDYIENDIPNNLQFVYLKSITSLQCQIAHTNDVWPVNEAQICTLTDNNKGACIGDSGGPLVWNGKLAGIVSWGIPCADGYPDVYTRVSAYADWINKKINE